MEPPILPTQITIAPPPGRRGNETITGGDVIFTPVQVGRMAYSAAGWVTYDSRVQRLSAERRDWNA
jgi:hypothetical protein